MAECNRKLGPTQPTDPIPKLTGVSENRQPNPSCLSALSRPNLCSRGLWARREQLSKRVSSRCLQLPHPRAQTYPVFSHISPRAPKHTVTLSTKYINPSRKIHPPTDLSTSRCHHPSTHTRAHKHTYPIFPSYAHGRHVFPSSPAYFPSSPLSIKLRRQIPLLND